MTFNEILDKYRQISYSERDKGERFERLMQAYLKTDTLYSSKFKQVWLWSEFPGNIELGTSDTGIDLVGLTFDGEYWAVQCKCYKESTVMDKPSVDSFLSTSSREFTNENNQTTRFAQRLWISTTNRWGANAEQAINRQNPPVTRINLSDLIQAAVDWEKIENGIHGEAARTSKFELKSHQKTALEKTEEHFKSNDRGKLIMACGTGKTFTSLRIAENETNHNGVVLFLVPSIALLGQTLREWTNQAIKEINPIAICSDPDITKQKKKNDDSDSFSIVDLAYPASTNTDVILSQFEKIKESKKDGMTVVFSTYQSIDVIAKAQKVLLENGFPEFDLVICDEAHRTTGVSLADEDESAFTKVHNADFIKAKKRLYMTATPRLYEEDAKSKAAQAEAILCSMDDLDIYGDEIYRIGFGEAVQKGMLTDYKVLILTLNDQDVPPAVQRMIADGEFEINTDDVSKLIGTINALSKQFLGDNGVTKEQDPNPMKRAVAFCPNISASKKISASYNTASEAYLNELPHEKKVKMVSTKSQHMDGTMAAPQRDQMLTWLKEETPENECRIITNVRVLSEGVDVPSLDAVLFLSARNSQVDVVQSVGRVMRTSPGKEYGYIIIPVVVPSDVEAEKALDDNERFKVVWTVLNALRAHDDRFNATINKIELNKQKPTNILFTRSPYSFDEDGNAVAWNDSEQGNYENSKDINSQLGLQFEQLQHVVFARMVKKVGDRRYWEQWAKNVAEIAERQVIRIKALVKDNGPHQKAFDKFLLGLQKNINPGISEQEAMDMLSQHIITKPVFEALFEGYSFVKNNPISVSMQNMLDLLEDQSFDKDAETLDKFYESVRMRAADIDNAEGKQRIIIELYDKFFKTAFPKMVEQLGIVYTPVEVVDFIVHSVNDVLKKEFGRSVSDENVHILDPFTGTGTFITRLLQSGLIEQKDLERKYKHELHANEIVLLAYYIASINIENAFHDATEDPEDGIGKEKYIPFDGIVLTDTFQLGESDNGEKMFSEMFPQNSERVAKQKKAPVRVIIGNPPYSAGQKSENDNAQNINYTKLDNDISKTYASSIEAKNINSLYNSYIKAFRWSTDRLKNNSGIISFITDGGWLDNKAMVGFRNCLEKEFSTIYIFNLRGNAHGSGEIRKKEAGNVFGHGSRSAITVTLLVKNSTDSPTQKAIIHYSDIGDYLSKDEKLVKIKSFGSVNNPQIFWELLSPNEHGDWINQRNDQFQEYPSVLPDKKKNQKSNSIFVHYSIGIGSSRDPWVYNFNKSVLNNNIKRSIDFYNEQVDEFKKAIENNPNIDVKNFIDYDENKISWSSSLVPNVKRGKKDTYNKDCVRIAYYRPFIKQFIYYGDLLIHRSGNFKEFFPNDDIQNIIINISSSPKGLDCLVSDNLSDYHFNGDTKSFPLYYYDERQKSSPSLFDSTGDSDYIRRDGISDFILERSTKQYGKNVTKEDIFYYVYGFLHSPEYREMFANDLKKMLPRLPLVDDVKDFWAFSNAGRKLAELHLNYETVPAFEGISVTGNDAGFYKVEKMRFPTGKKAKDKPDTIIYNSKITISNIPEAVYDYVVNGKSAIEWIMERYAVTTHKDSGIKNDPNDWADEVGNPRYILDLLLSIINVSVQTVEIVKGLPKIKFEN